MRLCDLVGFDYQRAILDLSRRLTYEEIAKAIGYDSKGSISAILKGTVPSHIQGEAIWALYCDTFGQKPPFKSSTNRTT